MQNDPVSKPRASEAPSPSVAADVTVSTASAIVRSSSDPYLVLVANSDKYPKPIIPGGKIETQDLVAGGVSPELRCVLREVKEELGTELRNPTYLGKALDRERGKRLVTAAKIALSVVDPPLPPGIAAEATVLARYGCPDYIFMGEVDEAALMDTEELKNPRFIDIRRIGPGDLAAGHDVIVLTYRQMLDESATTFPEEALSNFEVARLKFRKAE